MPSLNTDEILELLPHRPPFLLVDRVLDYTPGKTLQALKLLPPDDPVFAGHFPGNPVMPGVLIIEALAQASALLFAVSTEQRPLPLQLFAGIERARFRRIVRPGEPLTLQVQLLWSRRGLTRAACEASVLGQRVASAELTSMAQS